MFVIPLKKIDILVKLHGAFMVSAWMFSASLGILFARYFKQTWVSTQFMGKDLWFVVRFSFRSDSFLVVGIITAITGVCTYTGSFFFYGSLLFIVPSVVYDHRVELNSSGFYNNFRRDRRLDFC